MTTNPTIRKRSAAFTLIETMLYIVLFGFIALGALSAIALIQESSERSRAEALLIQEGAFISDKLAILIESSLGVSNPSRNNSSDTLLLTNRNDETFIRISSLTLMQESNGNPIPLTQPNVRVRTISFKRSESEDDPDHILFTLVLEGIEYPRAGSFSISRSVYLTL